MKVVARFHTTHGVLYEKRLVLPDPKAPKTLAEFIDRSTKAMKHFWPDAPIGAPTDAVTFEHEVVVKGRPAGMGVGWAVHWQEDDHDERAYLVQLLGQLEAGLGDPDPKNQVLSSAIERITGVKNPISQGATS